MKILRMKILRMKILRMKILRTKKKVGRKFYEWKFKNENVYEIFENEKFYELKILRLKKSL
jgi:hypothetical protein